MSQGDRTTDYTGVMLVISAASTVVLFFMGDDAFLAASVVALPTMLYLVYLQSVRPWLVGRRTSRTSTSP